MTASICADFPVDYDYLSHQTMGDKGLEQELLALFAVQCEGCDVSLADQPDLPTILEIAHQMKGCAKSIGAGKIAQIAGALEDDPGNGDLIRELRKGCLEARDFILLQARDVQ